MVDEEQNIVTLCHIIPEGGKNMEQSLALRITGAIVGTFSVGVSLYMTYLLLFGK